MNIGPETADAFPMEAQIYRPVALQFLRLRRCEQGQQQAAGVFSLQRRAVGLRQLSADTQRDGCTRDQQ